MAVTSFSESVRVETDGSVAVVVIDNPPVNALSHHVRRGLLDAMAHVAADADVEAAVLICAGRTFIAGADITEFDRPPTPPGIHRVLDAIENCPKPVVAAMHGTAYGGGLETALCAHYRVASASARLGLPEVKLGILPGAGGTQRLPRLVGVAKALEMCVTGDPIDAPDALACGLIDAIIGGDEANHGDGETGGGETGGGEAGGGRESVGGGADTDADGEAGSNNALRAGAVAIETPAGPWLGQLGSNSALRAGTVAFARRRAAEGGPHPRARDLDAKLAEARADPSVFDQFRARMAKRTRGFLAPEMIVASVANAVSMDFEAGSAREREMLVELIGGPQSAAQRHFFFAQRRAAKIDDMPPATPARPVSAAGIVGAGTMGGGIAMCFANAGIGVTLVERDRAALDRGLAAVRRNYERTAARGGITGADAEARMGLIAGSLELADLAGADMVIEAVFEDMDLKKRVFAALDDIAKPEAVLATNTSGLDVNAIAAVTRRPESVVGMHFFSPANVMELLEVVRGAATSPEVLATVMAIARRLGKIAVPVGVCPGFVGNRMLATRQAEAERIILEGAAPARVDRVLYDFGFPMGPFAMQDLAGLDIGWKAETSTGSTVREILNESGRRGQKNGRGYYSYDPDTRARTPDPEVEQMIRDFAAGRGIEPRAASDQEVLERCLYPMVNEGAKILDEGVAARPGDIDVVWVKGYGWPLHTGGPMFWVDAVGLDRVAESIRDWHSRLGGSHWELSPQLERLAAEGSAFAAASGAGTAR